MAHFVYILASRPGGALYTGRTCDLRNRVAAHRAGFSEHTSRYKIDRLVWFEEHEDFATSLQRERSLKRWNRDWKIALITQSNPTWQDITAQIPS
ncbi:GIY-YIG nuclease family protein [Roseovarius sp.]|uniref:GIY-YIG nuclease family protein n=1 Tax=Roseovarius sp. TaxID=1486281 RepID=UPI003B5B3A9D